MKSIYSQKILMALIFIVTMLKPHSTLALKFPIQDRIKTQRLYTEVYPHIYHDIIVEDDHLFLEQLKQLPDFENQIVPAITLLDKKLPKALFKALMFWRYIEPDLQKFEQVLSFTLFQKILILRDNRDSPYTLNQKEALVELQKTSGHESIKTAQLFKIYYPLVREKSHLITAIKDNLLFLEALAATKLFTYELSSKKVTTPYLISYLGFIPGNKVELISYNSVDNERMKWVEKNRITKRQDIDFSLQHLNMPENSSSKGNLLFQKDPIFIKIRDMIKQANESIFIDIFLLGGSLGATLSKYLIDQTSKKVSENPNFKVVILHDFASHKNIMPEMRPVFKYIKERITTEEKLKNNLFLLQANIQRHPSGSPFGLGRKPIANKELILSLQSNPNHFQSKFDHSKVIVIDGNTQMPAAYFGSKNWSDSNGAFFYDDSIYIEGPAAALVQASYFNDIEAALTQNEEELEWFFYKEEGFNNEDYGQKRDSILKDFAVTQESIPYQGRSIVRLAETNVDSKIVNTRQLLVDMIIKAKKKIYIEHQFFYDKYIVDTLIKKKVEMPKIDIKVIIDPNQNLALGGLPNTIFLDELISAGIEIRSRIILPTKDQVISSVTGKRLTPLNHRKIISVDSQVIMAGSSNITPNALQGSSREFGAQVFNSAIAKSFENRFVKDWNNPSKVLIMDIENFRAKLQGRKLNKGNSDLINKILSLFLRSKDQLEGR